MTITPTTMERAAEHYGGLLAELTAAPTVLPVEIVDVDGLEVCNTEVGDRFESFEFGPVLVDGRPTYLRLRCSDNVVLADRLRQIADDLSTSTFDERDRVAKRCVCGARIAPDEDTCGSARCEYQVAGF